MKRCPTCQKEFPDSMRFCQTDGTPLLESVEAKIPEDPFKTMVAPPVKPAEDDLMKTMVVSSESKEDDLLQIPEVFDPMKTVVASDDFKKNIPPAAKPVVNEPVVSAPEPPKFSEPNLSPPPSFGESSSGLKEPSKPIGPPKFESPFSAPVVESPKVESPYSSPFNDPPKFESPVSSFNEPPKVETPISSPFGDPPKFGSAPLPTENKPQNEPTSSPFNQPPTYKDSTFDAQPPPFENSPFNQPQTPFGQQQNTPIQQNDWNPPPAPVAGWQDQGLGANTPFTPPPAGTGGGQNQTLAIVSLVSGILSCLCCFSIITGPAAIIIGYMAKNKATTSPQEFGGSGLALAGMITGGIGAVIGTIVMILQILPYILR